MDITLIAIVIFILISIIFLALFLFKSFNKKSFTAEDGTIFETKYDLELYQNLFDKTIPLFNMDEAEVSSQAILGFQKKFLTKLTSDGFADLKTLIKYRKEFKSLSDLINT